jgi:hypothetical protein
MEKGGARRVCAAFPREEGPAHLRALCGPCGSDVARDGRCTRVVVLLPQRPLGRRRERSATDPGVHRAGAHRLDGTGRSSWGRQRLGSGRGWRALDRFGTWPLSVRRRSIRAIRTDIEPGSPTARHARSACSPGHLAVDRALHQRGECDPPGEGRHLRHPGWPARWNCHRDRARLGWHHVGVDDTWARTPQRPQVGRDGPRRRLSGRLHRARPRRPTRVRLGRRRNRDLRVPARRAALPEARSDRARWARLESSVAGDCAGRLDLGCAAAHRPFPCCGRTR